MAKLLENTYRHVNIALVNEMAIFCHELGIDLWDSIRGAATKPFGFQASPGPGVGGHCIPIDPNYLSYKVRKLGYPFRFVELAQEINSGCRGTSLPAPRAAQPAREAGQRRQGAAARCHVQAGHRRPARNPARPIARRLLARGAVLGYPDPYVTDWQVDGQPVPREEDLDTGIVIADVVMLLQDHSEYDLGQLAGEAKLFFDTRRKLARA